MLSKVVGVGVLALLAYLGFMWFVQRRVMFPSPAPPKQNVSAGIVGLEKVLIGENNAVEAWFIPPLDFDPPYPVIIFAHGNSELIDYWVSEFEVVRDWGIGVLLIEYPGYGRSQGTPSQTTITETFVSGHDYLAGRPDVRASAIVGYGRSLGGGAVCQLAANRQLAALILESTFSSVADVARPMGVPSWLIRDPFDNLAVLRDYDGPVLLLHGNRDRVIPFAHGERLHDQARQSVLRPMTCGHNDCPRPWEQIRGFLTTTGILTSEPRGLPSN